MIEAECKKVKTENQLIQLKLFSQLGSIDNKDEYEKLFFLINFSVIREKQKAC